MLLPLPWLKHAIELVTRKATILASKILHGVAGGPTLYSPLAVASNECPLANHLIFAKLPSALGSYFSLAVPVGKFRIQWPFQLR